MAPQLRSDGEGVLATWLEPDTEGTGAHRLMWSEWKHGAWSPPQVITSGAAILANWADVPSIARGHDGSLVAHWAEKREGGKYAYDAIVARSTDGTLWKRLGRLHDDTSASEHGFVSFVPDGDRMRAVWLDGRDVANGGPTTLRTALVGESVGSGAIVDDRVCDCCATAATATEDGPVVVYRDRSADDIRDIAVARLTSATWSSTIIGADNWKIEGCPVNGPAVAAAGRHTAVAWYTFANNVHRVRAALSDDATRTFHPPIDVDVGEGQRTLLGRVGIALDADGSAIVSWLAATHGKASLLVRRLAVDGTLHPQVQVAETTIDRASGVPRIARDGSAVVVMWTDTTSGKHLRAVRLESGEIP